MPVLTGSKTQKKDKDRWRTPPELFAGIAHRLGVEFVLDAAAEQHNTLCQLFISPEMNSLETRWDEFMELVGLDGWVWLNPPFSNVEPWANHVVSHAGLRVVVITNAATDTGWWHTLANAADQVWIMKGRVSFVHNETGQRVKGNNMGQTVFIFDPTGTYEQRIITVTTAELTHDND